MIIVSFNILDQKGICLSNVPGLITFDSTKEFKDFFNNMIPACMANSRNKEFSYSFKIKTDRGYKTFIIKNLKKRNYFKDMSFSELIKIANRTIKIHQIND
jgi:hypothetical protein